MKFEEKKLNEVLDVVVDNRGRNPKKYYEKSKYPVIDNFLIKNTLYPNLNEVKRYIDKKTYLEFLRGYLKKHDVLITLVGNGIGNLTLTPNDEVVIIQNTIGLRTKKNMISNEYLYYYLKYIRKKIINYDRGSSQPSIKKTDLLNTMIRIPNKKNQNAITNLLLSMEYKIELNNNIISNLEELAQTLFKRWFVDFEFPNEEGKPYKSSGGKMVESELGMIPQGWSKGVLKDITLNFDRKRVPLSKLERVKRDKIYPYYGAASLMDYVDDYIFDGIYVLVGEDGTVTDDKGYPILQYVWGKLWVNNHAHVLQGKNNFTTEFIYLLLKRTNVSNIVTGAVQPKINQTNLNKIPVIIPNENVLDQFNEIVSSVFTKIRKIKDENNSLEKLRDTLLPKLLSGEIELPDDMGVTEDVPIS